MERSESSTSQTEFVNKPEAGKSGASCVSGLEMDELARTLHQNLNDVSRTSTSKAQIMTLKKVAVYFLLD